MSDEKGKLYAFPSTGLNPSVVLELAKDWNLEEVLVIGWDADGKFTIGGSHTKQAEISWLFRAAEHWLSRQMDT